MVRKYRFRSNSDLCLTGYLREMLLGVIAYGIQFDLNLYLTRIGLMVVFSSFLWSTVQ